MLKSDLKRWKVHAVSLDGKKIVDKASFIAKAYEDLKLPKRQKSNWDSFSDDLWSALWGLSKGQAAIIWHDAHNMLLCNLEEFLIAVDCLVSVARQVHESRAGVEGVSVYIILIGKGANFQAYPR